ncbi:hypothetical protein NUW54_g14321 [Trametes sanguinea]|uniref:Uncharacterized protein n=1 Tax=Trametes sanguinea TaxID=158606 RepID=A0ACC1ME03_9APHY|nr:hypothetical protein NUW54_g14321 [Trametes sanguinea]
MGIPPLDNNYHHTDISEHQLRAVRCRRPRTDDAHIWTNRPEGTPAVHRAGVFVLGDGRDDERGGGDKDMAGGVQPAGGCDGRAAHATRAGGGDGEHGEPCVLGVLEPFDDSQPLVLTHGDLNLRNILVGEGGRLWLIDWGDAGFYPPWFEFVTTRLQQYQGVDPGDWVWDLVIPFICDPYYKQELWYMHTRRGLNYSWHILSPFIDTCQAAAASTSACNQIVHGIDAWYDAALAQTPMRRARG